MDYNGENYGNEQNGGQLGTGGQIGAGNGLAFIKDNWDNWGIKNWAKANFSARNFHSMETKVSKAFKASIKSITNWFQRNYDSIFGSDKPEVQPIATPQFSNFKSTQGWQNSGFLGGVKYGGDGSGSFMDYFHKFLYLTDQVNPIALVWDGISGYAIGEDRFGNALSGTESSVKIVSAIPVVEAEMLVVNAFSKTTARISSSLATRSIAGTSGNIAAKGSETFYRAMSNAEYAALQSNNGLTYMTGKAVVCFF